MGCTLKWKSSCSATFVLKSNVFCLWPTMLILFPVLFTLKHECIAIHRPCGLPGYENREIGLGKLYGPEILILKILRCLGWLGDVLIFSLTILMYVCTGFIWFSKMCRLPSELIRRYVVHTGSCPRVQQAYVCVTNVLFYNVYSKHWNHIS